MQAKKEAKPYHKQKDQVKVSFPAKKFMFFSSLKLAKSNLRKIGAILLLDLLFLASIFALNKFFTSYANSIVTPESQSSLMLMILIFYMLYNLIIIFVYSLFKHKVIYTIRSFFEKSEYSFENIWKFYMLNILLLFPPFILAGAILGAVRADYRTQTFILLGIPIALFSYIIVNLAHSHFCKNNSVKESLKKSFKAASKIRVYAETIVPIMIILAMLWLLALAAGYGIKSVADYYYNLYFSIYEIFKTASIVIFDIAVYFVIFVNRLTFYEISTEAKTEIKKYSKEHK